MYKKILVAYEGSKYSQDAFAAALDLAALAKSEILVLSVVQLPDIADDGNSVDVIGSLTNHYKKSFEALKAQATAAKITAHFEIVVGQPADRIVNIAEEKKVDLILIGTRTGRSFINKLILGSVAKQVVEYANCSVMVVRK